MFIRRLLMLAGIILTLAAPAAAYAQDPVTTTTPGGVEITTTAPSADQTAIVVPDNTDTTVVAPNADSVINLDVEQLWEKVFTAARDLIISGIGLGILWLANKVGFAFINAERIKASEQLIGRAVDAGYNATKGAVKGMELNIDVGSKVVANAGQYALDNGAAWLIKWLGGAEGVMAKAAARVPLDAQTTTKEVLRAAPAPIVPKK